MKALSILTGAIVLGAASAAHAQTNTGESPAPAAAPEDQEPAADADADGGVNEVVVTAQRRTENVQDIPASISVLGGDTLAASGVVDSSQLGTVVPGLVFGDQGGVAALAIRGIGTTPAAPEVELAVGIYQDGVYLPSGNSALVDFADIERIEVLRGPQGTLYGRNTTGGAINVITREPRAGFSGTAQFTIGNYGILRNNFFVTGGSDAVRASLSGYYSGQDGTITNLVDGRRYNDKNQYGIRGRIRLQPAPNLVINLIGSFVRADDLAYQLYVPLDDRPLALLSGGRFSGRRDQVYSDFSNPGHRQSEYNLIANIRAHFEPFDVVSITGYNRSKVQTNLDYDLSDAPLFAFISRTQSESGSQEFQFISNGTGPLTWIGGLYAFAQSAGYDPLGIYSPTDVLNGTITGSVHTRSYAAFGQLRYAFGENFSVTLGGRYSHETKSLPVSEYRDPSGTVLQSVPQPRLSFDSFSPMATLTYQSGDHLAYFTFSRGYKSGNYSSTSIGAAPVDPERITAFELGSKHEFFDRRLRLNWAAFHYDYSNLQVEVFLPNGTSTVQNAARSRTYGLELELAARPVRDLTLTFNAAYLHGRYRSFPNAVSNVPNPATGGYGFVPALIDATGNDTVRSPHWTFGGQLDYAIPSPIGAFNLRATYQHSGRYYFDAANQLAQSPYDRLNLRADWNIFDGSVTASLFMDNALNEWILNSYSIGPFSTLATFQTRRTYGATVAVRF